MYSNEPRLVVGLMVEQVAIKVLEESSVQVLASRYILPTSPQAAERVVDLGTSKLGSLWGAVRSGAKGLLEDLTSTAAAGSALELTLTFSLTLRTLTLTVTLTLILAPTHPQAARPRRRRARRGISSPTLYPCPTLKKKTLIKSFE